MTSKLDHIRLHTFLRDGHPHAYGVYLFNTDGNNRNVPIFSDQPHVNSAPNRGYHDTSAYPVVAGNRARDLADILGVEVRHSISEPEPFGATVVLE